MKKKRVTDEISKKDKLLFRESINGITRLEKNEKFELLFNSKELFAVRDFIFL